MSEERYVTIAEVKELLEKEHEIRSKEKGTKCDPAVEFKPVSEQPLDPMLEEEDTVFKRVLTEAMAHAEKTSKISKDNADKLVKELLGIQYSEPNMLASLRDGGLACKIADLMPKYPEDIRAIFSKERIKLEADDISKIIDAVSKYQ